jgi:hypothetical protein
MEIQTLKLIINEDDLNSLLPQILPDDVPIEDLRIELVPEGVIVRGEYPTLLLKMPFETLWLLTTVEGRLCATLASVKVSGVGGGMLRGVLMKMIRDGTAQEEGLEVHEASLTLDIEKLLSAKGLPLRVHLTAVQCGLHNLTIEAGTA